MVQLTVCSSGIFISSLLFKLKNLSGDAEGFLLGEMISHQVDTITDSQSSGLREEKEICLHSFVSLSKRHSFYDQTWTPDVPQLQHLLMNRFQDVVGWFSYRRNSSHRLSIREKAVHGKLATCFTHLCKQDFLLALVTEQVLDTSTICSTEYSFQYWDGKFTMACGKLATLPPAIPYQLHPTHPHTHPHYTSILDQQRSKFVLPGGDVLQQSYVMEELCAALLSKLQPLSEELLSTSRELEQVKTEVTALREEVRTAEKKTSQQYSWSNGCAEEAGTHVEHLSPHHPPGKEEVVTFVKETGSRLNTGLLVDIDTSTVLTEMRSKFGEHSHELQEPLIDLLSDCVLVPEKNDSGGGGERHNVQLEKLAGAQDTKFECLSQELF